MKSAEEILAFIDQYYVWMLERPHMYFENPSAMEGEIFLMERLRNFILDKSSHHSDWTDFLCELGYGAAGIAPSVEYPDKQVWFEKVSDVFRQYLVSQGRYRPDLESNAAI